MISSKGVKANMCCASCLHYTVKAMGPGNKCGFYTMSKFFQERGYKPVKGGVLP